MRHPPLQPELASGPFLGSDAVARGWLSAQQLRGRRLTRVYHGVYQSVDLPLDLPARVAAARLVLPVDAVVSGRSAAWLQGANVQFPDEPLEVTVPRGVCIAGRRHLVVRSALLPPTHVVQTRSGVRFTTPERTACDMARRADLVAGVVVLDALLGLRKLSAEGVLRMAEQCHGWRGVRQVPRVVALADARAESPKETELRVILALRGLAPTAVQLVIRDGSQRHIARVDLAYPEAKLALEYDGSQHADTRLADSDRERNLAALGWQVLRFTNAELQQPERLAALVARVLAQRLNPAE